MQNTPDASSADLLSLGTHCSLPECQQNDFLPFTCGACGQVYCLEHRTCAGHKCTKAANADFSVIVCPLCAKAVRLVGQEDPNAAFERHSAKDCDPDNYARVHKKKRCPVEHCKEKLVSTNTFQCKSCHSEICLKHRFPADHKCKERAAENAAARLKSSQSSSYGASLPSRWLCLQVRSNQSSAQCARQCYPMWQPSYRM
ncbi:hypothetical protein WJX73_009396 [Symbiochloris irregularis]|uniref:AN1-type domain-containing protein n=1 Tax=Symbiochloris irregularis TaxID=706552 RepID=A0AAW1P1F0_9CHLO